MEDNTIHQHPHEFEAYGEGAVEAAARPGAAHDSLKAFAMDYSDEGHPNITKLNNGTGNRR